MLTLALQLMKTGQGQQVRLVDIVTAANLFVFRIAYGDAYQRLTRGYKAGRNFRSAGNSTRNSTGQ